jgi:hypothetical protein
MRAENGGKGIEQKAAKVTKVLGPRFSLNPKSESTAPKFFGVKFHR